MDNTLRVYKSAKDYIIELIIDKSEKNNLDRKVYNSLYAKYRVEKAYVDKIYNKWNNELEVDEISSDIDCDFVYRKGQYISILDHNSCVNDIEIFFYLTKDPAFHNRLDYAIELSSPSYTGEYKTFYEDGRLWEVYQYKNGYKDGLYIHYDNNGEIICRANYKNDIYYGLAE